MKRISVFAIVLCWMFASSVQPRFMVDWEMSGSLFLVIIFSFVCGVGAPHLAKLVEKEGLF